MYEMVVKGRIQGGRGKGLNISGGSGEGENKFNKIENGEVRLKIILYI